MRDIYLLSGLGADKRVFNFIDLSGFNVTHITWVAPKDNESIEHYANRLIAQIPTSRPIIVGVSFGGMMAVEIAKQIETEKVILISSAETKFDVPLYFRGVGQLRLNKIMSTKMFKTVNVFTYWFFGTKTEKEKQLLRSIIHDTDNKFLSWAIDKIANWNNTTKLSNTAHIHGDADKIIPIRTADFTIAGGGHLMILNRGAELSELIRKILG